MRKVREIGRHFNTRETAKSVAYAVIFGGLAGFREAGMILS